jgi:hypothetical protein
MRLYIGSSCPLVPAADMFYQVNIMSHKAAINTP